MLTLVSTRRKYETTRLHVPRITTVRYREEDHEVFRYVNWKGFDQYSDSFPCD